MQKLKDYTKQNLLYSYFSLPSCIQHFTLKLEAAKKMLPATESQKSGAKKLLLAAEAEAKLQRRRVCFIFITFSSLSPF